MKSKRQSLILEIITNQDIETQEQLIIELEKYGYHSTQATISRDIKELRLVKEQTANNAYRYRAMSEVNEKSFTSKLQTIFRECVVSSDYAQNIVVLRTLPGLANAAASAIDSMNMSSVVGSLAGDDTVFVVLRDTHAAATFFTEVKQLF